MGTPNKNFFREKALVALYRKLECATRSLRHMLAKWADETAGNFTALAQVKFVSPLMCESSLAYELLQARGFNHSESEKGLIHDGEYSGVIRFLESDTGCHLHIVGADADDVGPLKGIIEGVLAEARKMRAEGKRALARLAIVFGATVLDAPGTGYTLKCSISDFNWVTGCIGDIGIDPGLAHYAAEHYPAAVDELLRLLMPALAKRMEVMSEK